MELNFKIIPLAALIPLVVGFIWYNRKTFGSAWMSATGLTPEMARSSNMFVVFGLTYLMSCIIAFLLMPIVIHQFGVMSVLVDEPGFNDPNSPMGMYFSDFMGKYGHNFRTFKHGALHGTITGLLLITPVITINSLFERRGFKYIAINGGFWTVCMALMGGVLCAFA
jgi:hypothetical protein